MYETQNEPPVDIVSPEYTRMMGETNGMREEQNELLAGRHMIRQTGVNPFFGKNHYLQDLEVEGQFLRPKNSNFEVHEKKNK
jgi:hypothetical protein